MDDHLLLLGSSSITPTQSTQSLKEDAAQSKCHTPDSINARAREFELCKMKLTPLICCEQQLRDRLGVISLGISGDKGRSISEHGESPPSPAQVALEYSLTYVASS